MRDRRARFRLGGGATPVGLIGPAGRGLVAAGRWAETGWAGETTAGRTGAVAAPVAHAGEQGRSQRKRDLWGSGRQQGLAAYGAGGFGRFDLRVVAGVVFGAVLFGAGFLLRGRRRTPCGRQPVFGRTGSTRRGRRAMRRVPALFGGTSVAYRGPRFGPTFGSVFQSRSTWAASRELWVGWLRAGTVFRFIIVA